MKRYTRHVGWLFAIGGTFLSMALAVIIYQGTSTLDTNLTNAILVYGLYTAVGGAGLIAGRAWGWWMCLVNPTGFPFVQVNLWADPPRNWNKPKSIKNPSPKKGKKKK